MRIPDVEVVPATWVAHHGENTCAFSVRLQTRALQHTASSLRIRPTRTLIISKTIEPSRVEQLSRRASFLLLLAAFSYANASYTNDKWKFPLQDMRTKCFFW